MKQKLPTETITDQNIYSVIVAQNKESRRWQNKEFAKNVLDKVVGGQVSDVEALALIMAYIAKRTNTNEYFVRDVTRLIFGSDKILSLRGAIELGSSSQNEFQWGNDYVTGEVFSDTGFKFEYNDSHFQQSCRGPEQEHWYNSNQLYHSMLGFNVGYFWGKQAADDSTLFHDKNPSIFGKGGHSYEDIYLGFSMSILGDGLRDNTISKNDAAKWVRDNMKDENLSPSRSKQELEKLCQIRSLIRKYERNSLIYMDETDRSKLWYQEDISKIKCNGVDIYYQYYYIFNPDKLAMIIVNDSSKKLSYVGTKNISGKNDINCDLINKFSK